MVHGFHILINNQILNQLSMLIRKDYKKYVNNHYMTRDGVVPYYVDLIMRTISDPFHEDIKRVNNLILTKWTTSGLLYGANLSANIENVRPIPLTEDWLKKIDWNGYVYLHFNSSFNMDASGHIYYRSDYTGINVSYLHELQNLYFAITGNELTLKP